MKITLRKIHEDAVLPEAGTRWSVGYDLAVCEDSVVPYGGHALLRTGLELASVNPMDSGGRVLTELQIRPRSSLFPKWGLIIPNSPGTVDSDYRGELLLSTLHIPTYGSLRNDTKIVIPAGTRLAQLVVAAAYIPYYQFALEGETVMETARGAGGFGSTG